MYSVNRMRKDWRKTKGIMARLSNYPTIIDGRPKSNATNYRPTTNRKNSSNQTLFCSNKVYESTSKMVFNDKEFFVSLRLDSNCLKILAIREN